MLCTKQRCGVLPCGFRYAVAAKLKVVTAFVGMFDELDEGTQMLKVIIFPSTWTAWERLTLQECCSWGTK